MTKKEETKAVTPKLVWNDKEMKSLYANVVNVSGGKEEIIALFGMNGAYRGDQEEIVVDLAERVVMTPYTAKRLAIMLNNTLVAYESKYGVIDIGMKTKEDVDGEAK